MKPVRALITYSLLCLLTACSPDEITPRSYVALLLADSTALRDEISTSLTTDISKLPKGQFYNLKSATALPMSIDFGRVGANGTITTYSKKYNVLLIQEPTVSQGKVLWSYAVYPESARPNPYKVN